MRVWLKYTEVVATISSLMPTYGLFRWQDGRGLLVGESSDLTAERMVLKLVIVYGDRHKRIDKCGHI